MAAGEGGAIRRWQEVSVAPTCRSCLRVVDTWFPKAEASAGIDPALSKTWINQAISRIDTGTLGEAPSLDATRDAVDWNTWVVDC